MMKKNVFVLLFVITIIIGIATPAFAERLKYTGLARSEGGAVLASATVAVYLAGTTTPADVYEASSGGTSVNEVTTDSNGRWTFYADTTDYAFTQEYKVVVTKDGYSSITLDNIFILRLPTNAAGALTNDGSGNYSWGDLGFDESANYSPTGDWTVTGTWDLSGGTVTLPDSMTLTTPTFILADDSTMTLPAAEPTGLLRADAGVMSTTTSITSVTIGGFTASQPMCSDGSGNATTCTTQPMIGAIPTTSDANGMSQAEMTSAGMYGRFYFATGAGTWNLPAAAAGMNICVYSTTAAAVVVNPDDADDITLNGTLLADGAAITSASGAGDFICLIAADSTHWYTLGRSGTWTGP